MNVKVHVDGWAVCSNLSWLPYRHLQWCNLHMNGDTWNSLRNMGIILWFLEGFWRWWPTEIFNATALRAHLEVSVRVTWWRPWVRVDGVGWALSLKFSVGHVSCHCFPLFWKSSVGRVALWKASVWDVVSHGLIASVMHLLIDHLTFSYCSNFVGRLKPILVEARIFRGGKMRVLFFKSW